MLKHRETRPDDVLESWAMGIMPITITANIVMSDPRNNVNAYRNLTRDKEEKEAGICAECEREQKDCICGKYDDWPGCE